MLIFDQLKKNDPQLRLLTAVVLLGLCLLAAGLWWVQIVSFRDYQANLQTQSYRTVRIPAVRGRILDRNDVPLAENLPTYNICLYLEELRPEFDAAYTREVARKKAALKAAMAAEENRLGRPLNKTEKRRFTLLPADRNHLRQRARYSVSTNAVARVGEWINQPLWLDPTNFLKHYQRSLALPYPILKDLSSAQVARFREQATSARGVDIETQSTRSYPFETTAAHLLGYLRADDSSAAGEEAFFSHRLPDYAGVIGIEAGFDRQLRGRAGAKSVLVNNIGYRQAENVWRPAEPGNNVRLTIDLRIQQAAERALPVYGAATRGAAVVMDVNSGDLLAVVSLPAFNPNHYVERRFPPGEWDRLTDPQLRPQINRATQENYAPGSVFKPVVGLAALDAGLDPAAVYHVQPHPSLPGRGCIYVGRRPVIDLAAPGPYDFRRALIRSSNAYFITNGLQAGIERILLLAQRLHLGERVGLPTGQETSGQIPSPAHVRSGWSDGDTANICMGQGQIAVTPLQMAVMTSAIANGGKVLLPRLVDRVEPMEPVPGQPARVFPSGQVRNHLGIRPDHLATVREAMLGDVEDPEGTGKGAAIPGFRISGKTGTAQVANQRNQIVDQITWFISFAPFEQPKYAVVVMVEGGVFGGTTCAPIARKIYQAILERDRLSPPLANLNHAARNAPPGN